MPIAAKLIHQNHQAPGDTLMLTAAMRDPAGCLHELIADLAAGPYDVSPLTTTESRQ